MGDSSLGALRGALASNLGVSKESSGSLMGLAAPVLMSMLAGKKKSEGLDIGGLIGQSMGQIEQIARAIPDDISNQLKGSGIFDEFPGSAGATVSAQDLTVGGVNLGNSVKDL